MTAGHGRVLQLQAALSASSATGGLDPPGVRPHHPITCSGKLRLEPDGEFACEHSSAPPGDIRTQACIDHSIALLLIELSRELL